jgi:hypothetical protein
MLSVGNEIWRSHIHHWSRLRRRDNSGQGAGGYPDGLAQSLFGYPNTKLLKDPLRQIDQPPANNTVYGGDRATRDDLTQSPTLRSI